MCGIVGEIGPSEMLNIDYEKLVSRADIRLDGPVSRRESGMPVGNGVMGSLVWTEPTMMKFQINRVDVYASGCRSYSFIKQRGSDYGFGVGFVDIDFVDFGGDVFTGSGGLHRLSRGSDMVDVFAGRGTLWLESCDTVCPGRSGQWNRARVVYVGGTAVRPARRERWV